MEYGGFQRCVNSLKRRGKEEACISADRAISTVFLSRFENRDQRRKFRGIVGYSRASQFRALRSAGTCTIQPLKSSGCIHPSFSLFLKHQDYVMNAGKCSTICGFHTSTIYFTVTTVNDEWNDAKKIKKRIKNNWILFVNLFKLKQIFIFVFYWNIVRF